MAANVKAANFNKNNLAINDHYNLEGLYVLSVIASIMLAGFAEAANKCDKYKDNNPLCIPSDEVIYRPMVGGVGRELAEVDKRLVESATHAMDTSNTAMLGTFMNLVQAVNGKLFTIVENTSKALAGIKNIPQLKQDITGFFDENKEVIKQMTRDPVVQAALREWVEEMGVLNIQLVDMAKPTIDRLITEIVDATNDAAVKATQGIISTSFNIAEAAIAEIPVAGGIIDLVLDFMRGFNSATQAAGPIVEFSTEAFFTALRTVFTTLAIVKEKSEDIQRAANKVQGAVENIGQAVRLPVLENFEQKGKQAGQDYVNSLMPKVENAAVKALEKPVSVGGAKNRVTATHRTTAKHRATAKKRANVQKRIKHVTRRLRKTLQAFMRRTKNYRMI
jgi:hypothetical protein